MNVLTKRAVLAAAAVAVCALPASAQNVGADATYSDISLTAGFTPDPYRINLQSGGGIDASNLGSPCRGNIASAPDVRLHYNNGSLPLIISVASDRDTTLVINAPDGNWYCNDDGGEGLNPSLRFDKPSSGRYEIWVGTYGGSGFHPAELNISELYSQ